jgi:hypothetical protein
MVQYLTQAFDARKGRKNDASYDRILVVWSCLRSWSFACLKWPRFDTPLGLLHIWMDSNVRAQAFARSIV